MDCPTRLLDVVQRALPALRALDEARTALRPSPGKWSPREIIGHLIDSASNNHQRFMRAQFQDDLIFPGYDQDVWVEVQGYQEVPFAELLAMWELYNKLLARVLRGVPEHVRSATHTRHSLDRFAFRTVPAHESATLAYFMCDYVDHLEHHLRQILGPEWDRVAAS